MLIHPLVRQILSCPRFELNVVREPKYICQPNREKPERIPVNPEDPRFKLWLSVAEAVELCPIPEYGYASIIRTELY